jgi:hypothetical protein
LLVLLSTFVTVGETEGFDTLETTGAYTINKRKTLM